MIRLFRAPVRATVPCRPAISRLPIILAVAPVVGALTISTAVVQRPAVSMLSAEDAEGRGSTISIVAHPEIAPGLAEVRIPAAATGPGIGANRLLALSPGNGVAAIAQQVGPGATNLVLAHPDGAQTLVELPGLISAAFAPDGTWLATVDGAGGLWQVQVESGLATRVAEGPFSGQPVVEPDGSVVALRVSSVEVPIVSRLSRVDADGSLEYLTDDQLVYGVQRLTDGSVAFVVHRPSGTQVWTLVNGIRHELADLGLDAIHATVSPSGHAVAWERGGQVLLETLPAGSAAAMAPGSRPRFAADGRTLLVERDDGSALIGMDGRTIATFAAQAGFGACAGECQS